MNQAKKRILIVDDDPIIGVALPRLLRDEFVVHVATTGKQALDMEPLTFDLILMDINMPELDGITTTASIRAQEQSAKLIPIIGITANLLPDIKEKAFESGMNKVLQKPILPKDIRELVSHYLHKK